MKHNNVITKISTIVIFLILIIFILGLTNCSKKDDSVIDNGVPVANAEPGKI